jgi:Rad3-related DNA helicase
VEALCIGSPFDYGRQMTLHLVAAMPEPNAPAFDEALEKWIAHFLTMSKGRAFVLFTSYKLLQNMAGRLQGFCLRQGWELLVRRFGETAFRKPESFFHRYASIGEAEALATAHSLWDRINLPNLRENIFPTRPRADLILRKGESHTIEEVALRKL